MIVYQYRSESCEKPFYFQRIAVEKIQTQRYHDTYCRKMLGRVARHYFIGSNGNKSDRIQKHLLIEQREITARLHINVVGLQDTDCDESARITKRFILNVRRYWAATGGKEVQIILSCKFIRLAKRKVIFGSNLGNSGKDYHA